MPALRASIVPTGGHARLFAARLSDELRNAAPGSRVVWAEGSDGLFDVVLGGEMAAAEHASLFEPTEAGAGGVPFDF